MNTKALRKRIIANMPAILKLMDIEHRHPPIGIDHDFRPEIVGYIKRIAKLKASSPSQARRAYLAVEKNVKGLKQSIARLPPAAQYFVKFEIEGLDVAESQIKNQTGRTAVQQKRIAAEDAHDLLLEYGGDVPTLTKAAPYIELANLLYLVATGKNGDLKKHCSQHVANLKADGFNSLRKRGPRPAYRKDDGDIPLKKYSTAEYAEQRHQRRKAAIAKWPPLAQIVDEVLGS